MKSLRSFVSLAPWFAGAWLCLLLGSGCAAVLIGAGAAAGVGGYAYVKGELKSVQNTSLDRAWFATQDALKELGYGITEQKKDALKAKFVARTAEDKKIEIELKSQGENSTELRIRVGTFGDEAISRQILDKIKAKL